MRHPGSECGERGLDFETRSPAPTRRQHKFWNSETLDFVATDQAPDHAGRLERPELCRRGQRRVVRNFGAVPEPSTLGDDLLGFAGVAIGTSQDARAEQGIVRRITGPAGFTAAKQRGAALPLTGTNHVLNEKALAPRREICISARSAGKLARGISVATDLDDIPVRPLVKCAFLRSNLRKSRCRSPLSASLRSSINMV